MVEEDFLEAVGSPESTPQEGVILRRDLAAAVSRLPQRWQTLVKLRFGLGLDNRETARCLGYRYSGIYTITKRCLAALAREMEALGWTPAGPGRRVVCPTAESSRGFERGRDGAR